MRDMEEYGVEQTRAPYPFRVHQQQALTAVEQSEAAGARRSWVVLPPGAGKTLVGLETARRRRRTTVVLGPNTAIQSQWLRGWEELTGEPGSGTRELDAKFTALTYQSLATFEADDEVDEEGARAERLTERPAAPQRAGARGAAQGAGRPDARARRVPPPARGLGPAAPEVLDELPNAFVLGLTATPPDTLTRDQKALVDELFGDSVFSVSIPAVVREGDLAPFAELAWLTTPTPTENDWLAEQGERFAELTTALADPAYGSDPVLRVARQRHVATGAARTRRTRGCGWCTPDC